jgi:hypothetical protein
MRYYVVNAGRGRSTHISREPVPGLAVMLLTGAAQTLCGLPATRQVDVFTPAEVSCRECRRRWELAPQPKPGKPSKVLAMGEALKARRQQDIETGRLDRSAAEIMAAGGSARAARLYERDSGSYRRAYLRRHREVARQLFPDGVPEDWQDPRNAAAANGEES